MAKINQLQDTVETVMDENGEVNQYRHTTTTTYNLGQEPPYIKLYLDTILYLQDIPQSCSGVLFALLKRMTYADDEEGQVIYTNSDMKKKIAKSLGITISYLDNILSDLVKGEVLERTGRGTFKVNSTLIGKGEWKDIGKLRLNVTFDAKGKTIQGEIERKNRKPNVDVNQLTLPLPYEPQKVEHIVQSCPANLTSQPHRVSI